MAMQCRILTGCQVRDCKHPVHYSLLLTWLTHAKVLMGVAQVILGGAR